MSLYQVTFDGSHDYVEAESMPAAIGVWKNRTEARGDWDGEPAEEPESVTLLSRDCVLRAIADGPTDLFLETESLRDEAAALHRQLGEAEQRAQDAEGLLAQAEHQHALAELERDAALDAIGRITFDSGNARVNTWRENVILDPALGAEVIELLRKRAAKRGEAGA